MLSSSSAHGVSNYLNSAGHNLRPGSGSTWNACGGSPVTQEMTRNVQDLLQNPMKVISLVKGGAVVHATILGDAADKIPSHLRPEALEAILINCKKDGYSPGYAKALVSCIAHFKDDLILGRLNTSSLPPRTSSTSASSINRSKLEQLILLNANEILRCLACCSRTWFGNGMASSEDDTILRAQVEIGYFGACLQALASKRVTGTVLFNKPDGMRIPIQYWLRTVLGSKPGDVNPVVHDALWACLSMSPFTQENFVKLLFEEMGSATWDISTIFVSELQAMTKKTSISGMSSLIHLNLLFLSDSNTLTVSQRHARFNSKAISALTKATLKMVQVERRADYGSGSIAFLMQLQGILAERDGVRWVEDALNAGLLSILAETDFFVSCSCLNEDVFDEIRSILHPFLTNHLVYYSVVRAAGRAMNMDAKIIGRLPSSPFIDSWMAFRSLLLERSIFMSKMVLDMPSERRLLHCEFCLQNFPLKELSKCAGCQRALYCSKSCQKSDWRDGDHKRKCEENKIQNLENAPMRTLDRFFMGHLASNDVRRHMSTLLQFSGFHFPYDPPDELYLDVNYNIVESNLSVSLSPLSDLDSSYADRVRELSDGEPFGSRLIRVHFFGREAVEDEFDFIFPGRHFSVPNDIFTDDSLKNGFRSNALYYAHNAVEDTSGLDDVEISSDPDEVDMVLNLMEKAWSRVDRRGLFPLTLENTRERIEEAMSKYRRDCTVEDKATLR